MAMTTHEDHQNGTGQMAQPKAQKLVVVDDGPTGYITDTARFEHLYRVARAMAASSLVPNHLKHEKGQDKYPLLPEEAVVANCFRVCCQAVRWELDPFSIIDETYVVGGKLAYSGKLVASVVNARAGLAGRLRYEFAGTGDERTVTVIGTFKGEDEPRTTSLRFADARTDNQMWRKDPDQKLIYSGVVKWARRHCPEVVLGVLIPEELDRSDSPGGQTIVLQSPDAVRALVARQKEKALPAPQPEADDIDQRVPESEPVVRVDREELALEYNAAIDNAETREALEEIVRQIRADDRLEADEVEAFVSWTARRAEALGVSKKKSPK